MTAMTTMTMGHTLIGMTETQHAPEGLASRPRIRPAEAGDTRPLSVSARLGRLQFHHSGKFRVLQVADVQDGPKIAKDTIALLAASLDTVRPDLVVFTGNQIAGYDAAFAATFRRRSWDDESAEGEDADAHAAALGRTRAMVQGALTQLFAPLTERGVPFAVTYGNHDAQCGLSVAQLDAMVRQFPGCLNPEPPADGADDSAVTAGTGASGGNDGNDDIDITVIRRDGIGGLADQHGIVCAPGSFVLPVADAEHSQHVISLVVLNSGDYARGGGFAAPDAASLSFLRQVPGLVHAPSLVFQHMPAPEYYGLLKAVPATTAYAMQGYRTHADTYYVLDEAKVQPGGYLGEGISCPDSSGEFALLRDMRLAADGRRAYIGMVAGHDHRNGFVGELDGVMLVASPTCGFGSYGPAPAKRATRLIEFDIRHPDAPRTQLLEFGDIVGKPSSKKAYTYALNAKPPRDGEGDDLLRRPSLWERMRGLWDR